MIEFQVTPMIQSAQNLNQWKPLASHCKFATDEEEIQQPKSFSNFSIWKPSLVYNKWNNVYDPQQHLNKKNDYFSFSLSGIQS